MKKTVLIVEDNELNMKLFNDLLEAHGYATLKTSHGIEAMELARAHKPDLILMGTGSEVHQAHEAATLLEADGVKVRLVSMPCLDRFAEQDQEYRDRVLPPSVRARVAVEAASPLGWHRWVGNDGDVVAMEGFGASAPAKLLYEHFGFSGAAIADRARAVLERTRS